MSHADWAGYAVPVLLITASLIIWLGYDPDNTREARRQARAEHMAADQWITQAIQARQAAAGDVLDQTEWIINAEAARIHAEMQPMFDFDDTDGPWPT